MNSMNGHATCHRIIGYPVRSPIVPLSLRHVASRQMADSDAGAWCGSVVYRGATASIVLD